MAKSPPGTCRQCWQPLSPPARTCEACRKKDRARAKARRDRLKEAGLCVHCGRPRDGENLMCQTCSEKHSKACKDLRHERIRQGLCWKCGDKAMKGRNTCRLCTISRNENDRRRREEWREAGLCIGCGKHKPKKGFARCESCQRIGREGKRRIKLRRVRATEFRRLFARNPAQTAHRFEILMRGKPRGVSA